MEGYRWDASLETGDPLVDQQHRDIHELVAYVEAAEDRPDEVLLVLDRLMEHVECHFATEEDLMRRSGYQGAEADDHVTEHHHLTQAARDTVLRFRGGELTSIAPLAEFLSGWLWEHVYEHDRAFIQYVKSRSVAAVLPEPWASVPPR